MTWQAFSDVLLFMSIVCRVRVEISLHVAYNHVMLLKKHDVFQLKSFMYSLLEDSQVATFIH